MKNGRLRISPQILFSPANSRQQNPYFLPNDEYVSRPDHITLSSTLQHYIISASPSHGQKIHSHLLKIGFKPNINISIKLLLLYLKSGCLKYARQMLDQMAQPTVSAYNYMISGYLKQNHLEQSLNLVRKLTFSNEKADGFTFSMTLKLSTSKSNVTPSCQIVKQVHAQILKSDVDLDEVLCTGLVDSYAKNGMVNYARIVFDKMLGKNVICSTAMITGYMKQGSFRDAEEIFEKTIGIDTVVFNAMIDGYSKLIETANRSLEVYIYMQRLNFSPTTSTFVSVIGACSVLSECQFGQQVQCQIMKMELFNEIKLGSALIDMFSKCGRIEDARSVFDHMPEKNVFSWTSMIDGYGKNGNSNEALQLFEKMRKEHLVKPNNVTFLSALSACAHAGLIAEGQEVFESMERDYSLKPRMEHYACMVDLLGRAGSLNKAWELIMKMPEKPDSDVWAALLGACRLHCDVEMAGIAANEIFKLTHDGRPGAYVALSNTFAAAGKWEGVSEVRDLMKERNVAKDIGYSWVGTDSGLYEFHAGERCDQASKL